MHSRPFLSTSTFVLAAASLVLSACNKPAADTPDPAPVAGLAPDAGQLPVSGPIRPASEGVIREPYRYIDDAYALGDAFGDSAPDYAVDYQGARPLIWRSRRGDYRVVEQTADGDRDYYYHAGADRPFLVRDPSYAYGYDGDSLAVIYDGAGRPVPQAITARDIDLAARYLSRARQLYSAAIHQQRQAAAAADWQARQGAVQAEQRQWAADRQRNDDWRRWHDDQGRRQQAYLADERGRRQTDGAQAANRAFAGQQVAQSAQAQQQAANARVQADASRVQEQQRRMSQDQQRQAENSRRDQAAVQARQQQAQAAQVQQQRQADNARVQADASRAQGQQRRVSQDQQRQAENGRRAQAAVQARQQQMQAAQAQQRQQADTARVQADAARAQDQQSRAGQARVQPAQAEQAKRVKAGAQDQTPPGHAKGQDKPHGGKPDDAHDKKDKHDGQ